MTETKMAAGERTQGDEQIISRCDVSVRRRVRLEIKIVRRVIVSLKRSGYSLNVFDGEEVTRGSERKLIDAIFAVDEARLVASKDGRQSFVFFVLGNDGYDVINDYGVSLEPVMSQINEWIDKLEDAGL